MQTKLELIKKSLAVCFKDAKLRSLDKAIRLNVQEINDTQLIALATLSVAEACEVKVKRSGTGLAIIIIL